MTEPPNDLATRPGDRTSREWRPLASSAWIVVLLAAILGWSWLIRTEPGRPRAAPSPPPEHVSPPPLTAPDVGAAAVGTTSSPTREPDDDSSIVPVPASPGRERPPEFAATGLAERALRDAARLRARGGWTRQVGLYCNQATVERLVAGAGAGPSGSLYVVPATHDGRSCFRLCWGVFPDREAADAAEVPPRLLAGNRPHSRPVSEVLP